MSLIRASLSKAFNEFIRDLQELKQTVDTIKSKNFDRFNYIVNELRSLSSSKTEKQVYGLKDLTNCLDQLRILKDIVYGKRLENAREFIKLNQSLTRMSTFELMEHDFRENTHSNVLRYILDYKFCGDASVDTLYKMTLLSHRLLKDDLKNKLSRKEYVVLREFSIGNGRIDILIKDEINKVAVIIENKLLANIGDKEYDESKNITMTQLDTYTDHFEKNHVYKSWEKYYILLNLKITKEFSHEYFKTISYPELFQIVTSIQFNDPIVYDYMLLLYSITNDSPNKIRLKELFHQVLSRNTNHNLNKLETIQHYNYGRQVETKSR